MASTPPTGGSSAAGVRGARRLRGVRAVRRVRRLRGTWGTWGTWGGAGAAAPRRAGPHQAPPRSGAGGAGVRAGPRARPGRRWGVLRSLLVLFVALCGAGALLGAGAAATYAYFARDLPSTEAMAQRHQFHTTRIYDRN